MYSDMQRHKTCAMISFCTLTAAYLTAGRAVVQTCITLPYHCSKYTPGENMSSLCAAPTFSAWFTTSLMINGWSTHTLSQSNFYHFKRATRGKLLVTRYSEILKSSDEVKKYCLKIIFSSSFAKCN